MTHAFYTRSPFTCAHSSFLSCACIKPRCSQHNVLHTAFYVSHSAYRTQRIALSINSFTHRKDTTFYVSHSAYRTQQFYSHTAFSHRTQRQCFHTQKSLFISVAISTSILESTINPINVFLIPQSISFPDEPPNVRNENTRKRMYEFKVLY